MKHTHAQLPFVQLDEVILTVSDGFTDWAASTVRRTDSDRIATAAFIVRACNTHYELVAALELFVRFFDEMPKGQIGKIVCDIGILNDAFISSAKVLSEVRGSK